VASTVFKLQESLLWFVTSLIRPSGILCDMLRRYFAVADNSYTFIWMDDKNMRHFLCSSRSSFL